MTASRLACLVAATASLAAAWSPHAPRSLLFNALNARSNSRGSLHKQSRLLQSPSLQEERSTDDQLAVNGAAKQTMQRAPSQPVDASLRTLLRETPDSSDSRVAAEPVATPLDRPLLAVSDALVFLLFAAIGKTAHATQTVVSTTGASSPASPLYDTAWNTASAGVASLLASLASTAWIALPFLAAWYLTSPLTRVYQSQSARSDQHLLVSQVTSVLRGWAVAVPLGILGRALLTGHLPPVSFVVVTLIVTLVFLILSRVFFAVASEFVE
jgi:Protein of unknown function (DUF3054)